MRITHPLFFSGDNLSLLIGQSCLLTMLISSVLVYWAARMSDTYVFMVCSEALVSDVANYEPPDNGGPERTQGSGTR